MTAGLANETRAVQERPQRVLVLAACEDDAALAERVLGQALEQRCTGLDEVRRELELGAGLVLISEEALSGPGLDQLLAALDQQPSWSDLPLVILSPGGERSSPHIEELERHATVIFIERTSHPRTLSSVVIAALRARRGQYALRDQLVERKRASETQRSRKAEFETLAEHSPDIICRVDRDLRHLYVNPATERASGLPRESYIGRTKSELGLPASLTEPWEARYRESFATGRPCAFEFTYETPGGPHHFLARLVPELDPDGQVASVLAITTDISAQKAGNDALRAKEERFRRIVDLANEGVWLVDAEGRTQHANDRMAEILGCTLEEVRERTLMAFVFPEDLALVHDHIARNLRGEQEQFDVRLRRLDGAEVLVLACTSPVKDPSGHMTGALGLFTDITERGRAESVLRSSEERYRAFVSQTSEGISRFEMREPIPADLSEDDFIARVYEVGYLAECNDALAAQYGFDSARDVLGASVADFMPRSDPRNQEYLRAFIRGGFRLVDGESYELDREGRIRCFRNNLLGIIENGMVVRAWGTQREITDIKTAEQALRQSEERLRVALRHSPVMVLHQDRNLRYTWAYNTHPSLPPEAVIGKTDAELMPPELAERVTSFKHLVLETGVPTREEIQLQIDGAIHTYDLTVEALRDENGAINGLTLAAVDISERKEAEYALLESERRFRAMADTAPTLVWLAGPDKRHFYFNKPWLEFTGRSLDQEYGSGWLEGVHPEDYERCLDGYMSAVEQERPFESDFRLRRADGEYRWVLNKGTPRYTADGTFLGFIGSCIDITERKLVGQRLAVEHAVTRALAAASDLPEAAGEILRLIGEGIGWPAGALWRKHPQRQVMTNIAFWHRRELPLPRFAAVTEVMTFAPGRGMPGRVYKEGTPIWAGDLTEDLRDARAGIAHSEGLQSGFAFPLSVGNDVLGVIEFFTDRVAAPDDGLTSMMSAIASELGQFLQRTRVEEERNELLIGEETSRIIAESALKRLRDVLAVTDTALGYLSLDDLLDELLGRVQTIYGCDTSSILLLSEDGTSLTVRASHGLEEEIRQGITIPVGKGISGRIAAEQQPVIIPDLSEHEVVSPVLRATVRSLVGTPLMVQNRLIGVIHCGSRTQRLFSREDLTLLELVAERAAMAIERVRLFEAERAALVRAEQAALRKDEAFTLLDAVFEGAPVGISFIDGELRYVRVNEALARMNGLPASEHLGRRMTEVVPDLMPKVAPLIRSIFETGKPLLNFELSGRTAAAPGIQYWLVSYYPIRDADGRIVYIAATRTDITERKRLEQELRHHAIRLEERVAERTEAVEARARELARSNADLEQFAYVASHDLQEPLRMVTNFTQLLARRYVGKLGPDADEFIGYAVDGVDRMHRLITDLLAYSRVGQRPTDLTPTDLESVLGAMGGHLASAIAESGAVITHDPLPTVFADQTQMLQLLQNLLGNAIKFHGPTPPRIHISAERIPNAISLERRRESPGPDTTPLPFERRAPSPAPEWLISVRDNGLGIPTEHAERIFVIFQRLHARDEYPGTGIGLAICKRIVERHGGRIWVEAAEGGGSLFRFTLPQPLGDPS